MNKRGYEIGTTSFNKGRSVCTLTNSNERDNYKVCGIYGNVYSQLPTGTPIVLKSIEKTLNCMSNRLKWAPRKQTLKRGASHRTHLSMNIVQLLSPF